MFPLLKRIDYCFSSLSRQFRGMKNGQDLPNRLRKLGPGSVDTFQENDVLSITLNNPSRKNGISGKMMTEFTAMVTDLESREMDMLPKLTILRGANSFFCSGGDLDTVKAILTPEKGTEMCHFMHTMLNSYRSLPSVNIAVVEGAALGGGAELITACDIVLCHEHAKIGFVQSCFGITPGWGGARRLIERIGPASALNALASGRLISASEAQDIRLVDHVFNDDQTLEDLLRQYKHQPAQGLRSAKRLVLSLKEAKTAREAEVIESQIFKSVWGSDLHSQKIGIKFNS